MIGPGDNRLALVPVWNVLRVSTTAGVGRHLQLTELDHNCGSDAVQRALAGYDVGPALETA